MKKYRVEYRVTNKGQLVDESRIFIEAQNTTEAEIKAYEQLDMEYEGIGRVKIQEIA